MSSRVDRFGRWLMSRRVVTPLSVVVVAGLVAAGQPVANASSLADRSAGSGFGQLQQIGPRSVVVPGVPLSPLAASDEVDPPAYEPVEVDWPESGEDVVEVAGDALVQVGDTVVSVGALEGDAAPEAAPEGGEDPEAIGSTWVDVEVLGAEDVSAYGGIGVGFRLSVAEDDEGSGDDRHDQDGSEGSASDEDQGDGVGRVEAEEGEDAATDSATEDASSAEEGAQSSRAPPAEGSPEQDVLVEGESAVADGDPTPSAETVQPDIDATEVEPVADEGVEDQAVELDAEEAVAPDHDGPALETARVDVDISGFQDAVGGNLLHRLNVQQVPDCLVAAVEGGVQPDESCIVTGEVLDAELDVEAGVLSVEVAVGSAQVDGDRDPLYVIASSSGGAAGTYAATPLTVAGSWDVGLQSGSFEYTYPLPSAVAITGGVPELGLQYSSGAVDGMTSGDHAQVSQVGAGWDLTQGYIEQQYASCGQVSWMTWSRDLCWEGEHYRIVLNGQASTLVRDADATAAAPAGVTVFRLQQDPNWRVERRAYGSPTNNGDHEGEWWRVYDTTGVIYDFGRGYIQRTGSTRQNTNSVWTVPVFGNDPGDPCYSSVLENGWCQQAWRWNLDRVQDTSSNTIDYFYAKETNLYRQMGVRNATYDRGGYLTRIEYSTRAVANGGESPKSRMVFHWEDRCSQRANGLVSPSTTCPAFTAANSASYPDVPMDLLCTSGVCSQAGPSFFSGKMLRSVTTHRLIASSWSQPVDEVRLGLTFPAKSDGTSPDLSLRRVQHTGSDGTNTISTPATNFAYTRLANRVDHNVSAGVPELQKWRLRQIQDELGATTDVTYGFATGRQCTAPWPTQFDTNDRQCFPRYWTPAFGPSGFGLFHKYVTLKVATDNALPGGTAAQITGSSDAITEYVYIGGGAWANDNQPTQIVPMSAQSYADWRGFQEVHVKQMSDPTYTGSTTRAVEVTQYRFYRGMRGVPLTNGTTRTDTIPGFVSGSVHDLPQFRGLEREQRTMALNSAGAPQHELTGILTTYTAVRRVKSNPGGANNDFRDAFIVKPSIQVQRLRHEPITGSPITSNIRHEWAYDQHGRATQQQRAVSGLSTTCTTIAWAGDAASRNVNKLDYPAATYDRTGTCANPGTLIGRTVNYYSGATAALNQPIGRGLLTRKTERFNSGTDERSTVLGYDNYGRLTTHTDSYGNTTTTSYNSVDIWTQIVTVTNPAGHSTTTTHSARRLTPTTVVDANGATTTLGYDALGRLIRVVQPGDSVASPTMSFAYTISINRITPPKITTTTKLPGGGTTSSTEFFDSFGQLRQVQQPAADGSGNVTFTSYRYDSRGNRTAATQPMTSAGTSGAALITLPTNAVQETRTDYDELSRPTASTYRHNGTTQWSWSSTYHGLRRATHTPPTGGVHTATMTDALGRTTQLTEGSGSVTATTNYTYDVYGNLATIRYPDNTTATHTYDWLGNRVSSSDPDTGTTTSTYDLNGNPVTTTRASGQQVTTSYDNLNRPTLIQGRQGPSGPWTDLISYTYDTQTRGVGRPASQTTRHPTGDYTQTTTGYTTRGLPQGTTYAFPALAGQTSGTSYTVSNTYSQGLPTATTYPAIGGLPAETVNYTYTPTGLPDTMVGASTYVRGTTYLADGTIATRLQGAATSGTRLDTTFTHNIATRRLANVTTTAGFGSATQTVINDTYTWSAAGNLTRVRDTTVPTAISTCHKYDELNRLVHSWSGTNGTCPDGYAQATGPAPYNTKWTYNAVGNITSITRHGQGATTLTYGDSAHRHAVTAAGSTTYTYTQDGQVATRTQPGSTETFAWDLLGNLSSVTVAPGPSPGGATQFVHGPGGVRHARVAPDGTATIYLGSHHEITITDGVSTATRYHAHDGHTIAIRTTDGLTWQTSDRQGSTQVQVPDGTTTAQRFYTDPYGLPRTEHAPVTDRNWLGKTTDPTTGLVHLGHRYYDPTIGRFLSADPLLVLSGTQSVNPYTYANNNPVAYTDPTGLAPFKLGDIGSRIGSRLKAIGGYVSGRILPGSPLATLYGFGPSTSTGAGGSSGGGGSFGGGGTFGSLNDQAEPIQLNPDNRLMMAAPTGPNWAGVGVGAAVAGLGFVVCPVSFGLGCAVAAGAITGVGVGVAITSARGEDVTLGGMVRNALLGATGGAVFRGVAVGAGGASAVRVSFGGHSVDDLSAAAARVDRNGLTAAGRALQKHGDRPTSVFPQSTGTATQRNTQGQEVVNAILRDPGAQAVVTTNSIKIYDSLGRGLSYTATGRFIGLLEP